MTDNKMTAEEWHEMATSKLAEKNKVIFEMMLEDLHKQTLLQNEYSERRYRERLRDEFAGRAMAALIVARSQDLMQGSRGWPVYVENDAWLIADAMLEKRGQP